MSPIDANSKILIYATTCICWNTLGKCFNSLFWLPKRARLIWVLFFFSSNSEKEVKRRKIWTMWRSFELCLQAPKSVSKQCEQTGHSFISCIRSCTILLKLQKPLLVWCAQILINSIKYFSVALFLFHSSIHCGSSSSAILKPVWSEHPFLCV